MDRDSRRYRNALLACHLRMSTDKSWAQIADDIGVADDTIYAWRKKDWWQDVWTEAAETQDTQFMVQTARRALIDILNDSDANDHSRLEAAKFILGRADPEYAEQSEAPMPMIDNRSVTNNFEHLPDDDLRGIIDAEASSD